jgi:gluconolactonase
MDITTIATGLRFPEGPVAMDDGSILLVEIARGTLSRVTPDGAVSVVAEVGGGPNGCAIGPDGAAYITNNGGCFHWEEVMGMTLPGPVPPEWNGGCIQRVDLATGEVTVLYTESSSGPLRAPNDLVFDAHGGFWFTDHGVRLERTSDRTGLHYAKPDGSSCTEVVFPLDAPNGIGLSPDGSVLYAVETHTGRAYQWQVTAPGQVPPNHLPIGNGGSLLGVAPGGGLFDSLAVDGEGWVCIGTLGNGGITAMSPDGSTIDHIGLPDPLVTNICFGGEDLRTAYATLSGTGQLVAFPWPRKGLQLAYTA